jgi:hypothetical protein
LPSNLIFRFRTKIKNFRNQILVTITVTRSAD